MLKFRLLKKLMLKEIFATTEEALLAHFTKEIEAHGGEVVNVVAAEDSYVFSVMKMPRHLVSYYQRFDYQRCTDSPM